MALIYVALDTLFIVSALAVVLLWRRTRTARARMGLPLPPGPPGLPIIGNLFDMPTSNDWVVYRDLGVKHSLFIDTLSLLQAY